MSVGATDQIVVDASVAAKWLLSGEEYTDHARLLLRRFAQGETRLTVPSHLRYEVPSAIIAATLGRAPRLSLDQDREAIEEFLSLPLQPIDSNELILSAVPLVHQLACAFYDALYLALAQRLHAPFITADRKFYQPIHQLSDIIWLGDYR